MTSGPMDQQDSKALTSPHRFVEFISNDMLDLSRQGLTDSDMIELSRFLREHPTVKHLNLSLNNIGDQGIADFAERNQTVISVNFTGNNISDGGVAVFAYKNQVIETVNFMHNLITHQGIDKFAQINETCSSSIFSAMKVH